MYVISHGRDCDGSPLYTLAGKMPAEWAPVISAAYESWSMLGHYAAVGAYGVVHGYGEEALTVI